MASFNCSSCGKRYNVDDSAAGRKFQCKQCGKIVRVPTLNADAAPTRAVSAPAKKLSPSAGNPAKAPAGALPPKTTTAPKPPPVVKSNRPAPPPPILLDQVEEPADSYPSGEDGGFGGFDLAAMSALAPTGEVDETGPYATVSAGEGTSTVAQTAKPKPAAKFRAPSFGMPSLGFRVNRLILLAIVGGIVLFVAGGREWLLASSASDEAQNITCADLGANGPGDNLHVHVTDFYSLGNFVWHGTKADATTSADWQTVWFPIIPKSLVSQYEIAPGIRILKPDNIPSDQIHVLIKTTRANNRSLLDPIMRQESFDGMVINKIESLTDNERDLLRQAYPAMFIGKCYILEEGREPRGGLGMLMMSGGAIASLFGLFLMFKPS